MDIKTGSKRLYRIEIAIVVLALVATVAMSGTAAAAANSASVSATPNPIALDEYAAVEGKIDLQAIFFCGGYTLETHLSDELTRPMVLSTNTGGGQLTTGYSDTINERAWRWKSGFETYCGSPTKYVRLGTSPTETGFHEMGAGSDYFHPSKWEQSRMYAYYYYYR